MDGIGSSHYSCLFRALLARSIGDERIGNPRHHENYGNERPTELKTTTSYEAKSRPCFRRKWSDGFLFVFYDQQSVILMSLQNHIIMICSSKKVFDNLRIMIKISRLVTSKMVRRRLASFCIMCMFGCFRPLGYSSKAKADWKRDCLACPEESPRRMYVPAVYSWICS